MGHQTGDARLMPHFPDFSTFNWITPNMLGEVTNLAITSPNLVDIDNP